MELAEDVVLVLKELEMWLAGQETWWGEVHWGSVMVRKVVLEDG